MPHWDIRVEIHEPDRSDTHWEGEAEEYGQAISRALSDAEKKRGRPLDPKVRITLTIATA